MLIGAGGGGGVDSGSALLYKPSIGLEYDLNNDFSLQTAFKKISNNSRFQYLEIYLASRFKIKPKT